MWPLTGLGKSTCGAGAGTGSIGRIPRWRTSIFPAATDRYDLPVKKAVRSAEGLEPGDRVRVRLELVDL